MMRNQIEIENNTAANSNKAEGTCPGCGRHCPLSAPHCGKGEAYARMQQKGEGELPQEREFPQEERARGGHHDRGGQREDGAPGKRWGRGEHAEHREHRDFGEHGGHREEGSFAERGERGEHPHRHWYERQERGGAKRGPHAGGEQRDAHHGEEEDLSPLGDHEDGLSIRLRLACDRILRSGGRKRGQERILEILKTRDAISQRDLLYLLHIQPGSLSEILNKLEAAEEIERVPDEQDRRRQLVRLTEAGKKRAERLSEDQPQDPYAVLTEEEKKTLSDLLDKLIDATEEED